MAHRERDFLKATKLEVEAMALKKSWVDSGWYCEEGGQRCRSACRSIFTTYPEELLQVKDGGVEAEFDAVAHFAKEVGHGAEEGVADNGIRAVVEGCARRAVSHVEIRHTVAVHLVGLLVGRGVRGKRGRLGMGNLRTETGAVCSLNLSRMWRGISGTIVPSGNLTKDCW